MKYKTTDRAIRAGYNTIIKIGYCNAQFLLRFCDPVAYNHNRNGWKYDVYEIDGVAIVTGYQPLGNVKPDYDMIRAYDKKAAEILSDYSKPYETQKAEVSALLKRFIAEVTA